MYKLPAVSLAVVGHAIFVKRQVSQENVNVDQHHTSEPLRTTQISSTRRPKKPLETPPQFQVGVVQIYRGILNVDLVDEFDITVQILNFMPKPYFFTN